MMAALRYAIEEAAASLWRGRRAGLFSMATIALALFVLGGFLLVSRNLDRLADEWRGAAEMSVFMADDVSDEDRQAIEAALAPGQVIAAFEYVAKAEALRRFKRMFGDLASAIDALEANPLPASYEVRLQSGAAAPYAIEAVVATLRRTQGVSDVRYDRQWLDRLLSALTILRRVGLILGGVLALAAALTVANVVRLAIHARRHEIEIMQLVGAPQAYVRGPFLMEGVLQGGIGAVAALAGLVMAFMALRTSYLSPLAAAVNLSAVSFLSPEACLVLVTGGMLVGCLGGAVATRIRT
jgi:cell division transport system permease protein